MNKTEIKNGKIGKERKTTKRKKGNKNK